MERDEKKTDDYSDYYGGLARRGKHMNQVQKITESLMLAIEESEEYRRYQKAKQTIFQYPVLKEKADEFRRRNYEFQCSGVDHFTEGDRLAEEFSHEMEHPAVWEYLEAENALCRVVREINWRIFDRIDFELDFDAK